MARLVLAFPPLTTAPECFTQHLVIHSTLDSSSTHPRTLALLKMTTQPLSTMLSGMHLSDATPTPAPRSNGVFLPTKTSTSTMAANPFSSTSAGTAGAGNRLPPVLQRYMNPDLIRPPNTGLSGASSSGSSTAYGSGTTMNAADVRGPLLKLAGLNIPHPDNHLQNQRRIPLMACTDPRIQLPPAACPARFINIRYILTRVWELMQRVQEGL